MRHAMRWILPVVLAWAAAAVHAAAPVAGKDYTEITPAQPTTDARRVVVTEFFSYGCPHCAAFAPAFAAWKKSLPADVLVERVPVSLGYQQWQPLARTYVTLVALKNIDKVDDKIFAAIHQQGVRLETEEQITRWLGTQGIDAKAFTGMYRSFGVDTQYKAGEARSREHRIPSIPTLVIDGRYLIAIEDMGTSREAHFKAQLAVANALIARAKQQHASVGAAPAKPKS